MKTAYILFRNRKPENQKEVLDLIMHFCREHNLQYRIASESEDGIINIEGADYYIDLQEKQEGAENTYWMIYCLLKNRLSFFKNIA